jgi:HD-like signal output (HDOD) protein
MSKRILFVDDEPMVLAGLQRSLRSMQAEWKMVFVNGGAQALKEMAQEPFDIIVTDMRMPLMTGAQLLEEVKRRFPQCFRIILSGQADQETILRSVDPTHQFLAKPCQTSELKMRLQRAFAVRDLLKNEELRAVVSQLEALPSLPQLYVEVTTELQKGEPSIPRIAELVSRDMAMTAKVLQLVNSAFFGLRCHISSAMQAIQMLGLDTLRALVLSTHVFEKFRSNSLGEPEMSYLWKHSLVVASFAKKIAELEKANRQMIDDCFTAGLLHDSGKLILSSALAPGYSEVLELVRQTGQSLFWAENQVLGCSHAEVAAYLLGLWGLPETVVDGVAGHHEPWRSSVSEFSTVIATHVASIYHEQQAAFWLQDRTSMDVEALKKCGCLEREKGWRQVATEPVETWDAIK